MAEVDPTKAFMSYSGELTEGQLRTGRGVMDYRNGDHYEGYFHKNKRHGHGTFKVGGRKWRWRC
jgi:hypothetical protein